ncbi:MAG: D-alanyl-D-alanine carboxypeptidase family protein [Acidimicrobiia bacterium]
MDGIAAVQGRIAAITARFEPRAPTAPTAGAPGDAPGAGDFASTLAALLGPGGATAWSAATGAGAIGRGGFGVAEAAPGVGGLGGGWGTGLAGPTTSTGTTGLVGPGLGGPVGATGLTPALRLAPGGYGRIRPPAELVAYGNGRIPAAALEPIGIGEHRLWAPAARALRQALVAAAADGVQIGVTDSYRDLAGQESLAARKGLYSQGGLAATPGTSNHGWGLSVDLDLDATAQAWMRDNGWRFGFVEDVPREPWHWTYRPAA